MNMSEDFYGGDDENLLTPMSSIPSSQNNRRRNSPLSGNLYNRIRGVVRYGVADKFLVHKEDDPGFDGNLYVGHNINVNE